MKIAIIHGYDINRSGSCLYVKNISMFLKELGHEIHLICQELSEELPDFINNKIIYDCNGNALEETQLNNLSGKGKCTLHIPHLGKVLPVYNWDVYEEFNSVKTFLDLTEEEFESYMDNHKNTILSIVNKYNIEIVHANHAVGLGEAVSRIKSEIDCPFLITPHGSAIEYTVKKSQKYLDLAFDNFSVCDSILVGGTEMTERIDSLWGKKKDFKDKITKIPTGTNLDIFKMRKTKRANNPNLICSEVRGCTRTLMDELYDDVKENIEISELQLRINIMKKKYHHFAADFDLQEKIDEVKWGQEKIIAFAGKLIVGKGVHCLITAMANLENHKLIVIGEGSFREGLELLVRSISRGNYTLFKNIVSIGWAFDNKPQGFLEHLEQYLEPKKFNLLHENAKATQLEDRILFMGYLNHENLSKVLANSNSIILPSIVNEAYPLSLVESLAVGILPLATNFGGTKKFLDLIDNELSSEYKLMRLNIDKNDMVPHMADVIYKTIKKYPEPLSRVKNIAEEKFSWKNITKDLAEHYQDLINKKYLLSNSLEKHPKNFLRT